MMEVGVKQYEMVSEWKNILHCDEGAAALSYSDCYCAVTGAKHHSLLGF